MLPTIYDHVTNIVSLDKTAKDPFPDGSPLGVTVHYTGGPKVVSAIRTLIAADLGYHLLIDRDGAVFQMTSFNRKCWHAGKAVWLGRSPNHHHVSVSLSSWGYLDQNLKTYTGQKLSIDESSYRPDNVTGRMYYWHKATDKQIVALRSFLYWTVQHGIDPDAVCGHDEACLPKGRKLDPGGVLPFHMSELRDELRAYKKNSASILA
jgi:N-acetylmuramoyl-L-alanine amidase